MLGIVLDDLKEDVTKLTDENRGYVAEIGGIHTEDVVKEYEDIKENVLNRDGTFNFEFIKTKLYRAVFTMESLMQNATEVCECCGGPKLSEKDLVTYNEAHREVNVIDYALYQKYSDYDTCSYKPQNEEKIFDQLYDKARDGEISDTGIKFSFIEMVLKNGEHFVNINRFELLKLLRGEHAEVSYDNDSIWHHDFKFENMPKELADLILFYRETLLRCQNHLIIADGFSGTGFICLENYILSELTKKGYFEDCEDDKGYSVWNPKLWTEQHFVNVN